MHAHVVTEDLHIPARDGLKLAATLHRPAEDPVGTVQVHSGIGVKRQFYAPFAAYLAEHGYATVTFDYRGIGGSRPTTLRGSDFRMNHWGNRDMPAVLDWLEQRFPNQPKFAFAHSMGGQLIGLMDNNTRLTAVVMVATATAYWRAFAFPFLLYPTFMWYVYLPVTIRVFGYAPTKRVGAGEDLPKGVAQEWADWCRTPAYISRRFGNEIDGRHYEQLRAPIRAYALDDDPIAPRHNCESFLRSYYRNAPLELRTLRGSAAAGGKAGHFGYFRRGNSQAYWHEGVRWLNDKRAKA